MPNYQYACVSCDKEETINRPLELRDTHTTCPICGYGMVRVWSPPGIQFKGSGFYSTDKGGI